MASTFAAKKRKVKYERKSSANKASTKKQQAEWLEQIKAHKHACKQNIRGVMGDKFGLAVKMKWLLKHLETSPKR